MKNKKNILIIFILIILSLLCFFSCVNRKNNLADQQTKNKISINAPGKIIEKQNIKKINSLPLASNKKEEKKIKITFIIIDKKYETEIKEGDSVFLAMQENKVNKVFDFTYTETLGLGSFITGINNQLGSPGKYWMYYVNGLKASVGASQYILKEGDIISWQQEGI